MKFYKEEEIKKAFAFLQNSDNSEHDLDSILQKMNFFTLPSKDDIISKINKDARFHYNNSFVMDSVYTGAEWLKDFIMMKSR